MPYLCRPGILFGLPCWVLCIVLCGTACRKSTNGDSSESGTAGAFQPIVITTKTDVAMVLVPAGTFTMGSDNGAEDERPAHEVTVSAFAIDAYEVTQAQYAALELPDPSHFKDPKRPVEQVRWSDAAQFCNLRSIEEGLDPCYDEVSFVCDFNASGYRLPTEAEWEYAARAGSKTDYAFGGSPAKLKSHACYSGNSNRPRWHEEAKRVGIVRYARQRA